MKKSSFWGIVGSSAAIAMLPIGWELFSPAAEPTAFKAPTGATIVKTSSAEGETEGQNKRKEWMDRMHKTPTGVDWKKMDLDALSALYERKRDRILQKKNGARIIEEFAGGRLKGEWNERGSLNQAGSIGPIDVDLATDMVYCVSAGGTLWKGGIAGTSWEVINDHLLFDWKVLKVFDMPTGKRILASQGGYPVYSDDNGVTWTEATGFDNPKEWGGLSQVHVLDNTERTIYALSLEWDWVAWHSITCLYKSNDKGVSFSLVHTFTEEHSYDNYMWSPYGTNDLYVLENSQNLYKTTSSSSTLTFLNNSTTMTAGDTRGFAGNRTGGTTYLYALDGSDVYLSTNEGATWTYKGSTPEGTWCGVAVSKTDPAKLFMGGVELYRSYDSGVTWTKLNNWWDYYGDVPNKIHADMMYINSWMDGSSEFYLIGNHGGINYSTNHISTTTNISLSGLNVSQYYTVYTDENDPNYIYAGSQDQGFQRANGDVAGVLDFVQVISGDYGHHCSGDGGSTLWSMYPGSLAYYTDAHTGGPADWFDLSAGYFPYWIPPTVAVPGSSTTAWVAGGYTDSGSGSHIVEVSYTGSGFDYGDLPYDFGAASGGGSISAMAFSPIDADYCYVLTDNGKFFYSTNQGVSWTMSSTATGLGAHYFYGATIYPSKVHLGHVFIGGNGYSTPPVFQTVDNGATFVEIQNGDLPNTLVYDLVGDYDDSFIFAATEVGPFVYDVEMQEWHDLSGVTAPAHVYWTVEYVPTKNTVRFGTYGRGIWDFKINGIPATGIDAKELKANVKAYPNPSSQYVNISWELAEAGKMSMEITDLSGRKLLSTELNALKGANTHRVDVTKFSKGVYVCALRKGDKQTSVRFVVE